MKTESPVSRNTQTPVTLCSLQKNHKTQRANLKTRFTAIMATIKELMSFLFISIFLIRLASWMIFSTNLFACTAYSCIDTASLKFNQISKSLKNKCPMELSSRVKQQTSYYLHMYFNIKLMVNIHSFVCPHRPDTDCAPVPLVSNLNYFDLIFNPNISFQCNLKHVP